MATLLTGHGLDREAFDAARRLVGRSRLVVVTADPKSVEMDAVRENERLTGVDVDVVGVDAADLLGTLAAARAAIQAHRKGGVRVHVGGGPNLVTTALMLAAFEEGVEAFFCHARGVSRLPVAVSVKLADRILETDRGVLLALPVKGEATQAALSATSGLAPATLKGALLRLRKAGLVRADHLTASLTAAGHYYRSHFVAAGGSA
ncbi:MAG TPA: hypothetical protein VM889_10280 [Candidatus Thermoplasmatota archaeon]|nr:hypothetical protein [Candidatus Thermoplasmatota archaeon]